MRRIFSTVFGPQEPALTVGSLAIRATRRPSISATPVTTPSAPSPSSCPLGRGASPPAGAGLDGRLVGHQGPPAAVELGDAGDDAAPPQPLLLPVGEQALLGEGAR